MKRRLMLVSDFMFNIEEQDEKIINDMVQFFLDKSTEGRFKFKYVKKDDGYHYEISRYLPYAYETGFIIDLDCMILTGIPIEEFRSNPLDPQKKPPVFGIPGRDTDGFYLVKEGVEELYKVMVGHGENTEKPKKVSILATSELLSVDVKYL